ncbi:MULTISPECIES: class I SAM-dependent methyltransferase [unclassified Sinorhizobium]|uniref:class I SAM-dependent methyltransferase n=1 Tax=unclassified Sinorhizobium TaxID=2613772 RepID=UPI0035258821
MSDGWEESAEAWIADTGDKGDFGRQFVLDRPMLERVRMGRFRIALDVGCGEGRFCRRLSELGISTVGIDPTTALIEHARRADPKGDYRIGRAESLDFAPGSFDLVVSYLTFIDIAEIERAIAEMCRVLRPSGSLLIANLNGFQTAAMPNGWVKLPDGERRFTMDRYMEERAEWVSWRGIRIKNWHRPMSTYFKLLLEQGLQLSHFDEPVPHGGEPTKAERYGRVPYFHIMEWRKPAAG